MQASLPGLTLAAGPHVAGPHLAGGPTLTAGSTLAASLDFLANFTLEQCKFSADSPLQTASFGVYVTNNHLIAYRFKVAMDSSAGAENGPD